MPSGKNPSAPRPPKAPSQASKPRQRRAVSNSRKKGPGFKSVESWSKVVRNAPWVGGQSAGLNPGGTKAISRRKSNPKFTAQTKRVIRPRVKKRNMT